MTYKLNPSLTNRVALLLISDIQELLSQIEVCGLDSENFLALSRTASDLRDLLQAQASQD
jgi:hypothetical protein